MFLANRTLDDTITFSASSTQKLTLPRDRWIRSIMLYGLYTATYSSGTAVNNGFEKLITNIRVVANGNDQLKYVDGYRLWVMNKYLHGTPMFTDNPISSDSATTKKSFVMLHFALNPSNPFDYSALLPAHLLSSLDLYVTFGAVTQVYSGGSGTITGTITATVTEAFIEKSEETQLFGINKEKLFKLYESESDYTITATVSDYSQKIDIPVGTRILKLGVFTQTSSAYSDGVVSKYRLEQQSPVRLEITHSEWYSSKQDDKLSYGLSQGKWTTVVTQDPLESGFTMIDPSAKGGFIDTRGMKQGDLQLKLNTVVSSGTVILYKLEFI